MGWLLVEAVIVVILLPNAKNDQAKRLLGRIRGCDPAPAREPFTPINHEYMASDIIGVMEVSGYRKQGDRLSFQLSSTKIIVGSPKLFHMNVIAGWPGPSCYPTRNGERVMAYVAQTSRALLLQDCHTSQDEIFDIAGILKADRLAKERRLRQSTFFSLHGALSKNDPKVWITREDYPDAAHAAGVTKVTFDVSDSGELEDCRVLSDTSGVFGKLTCDLITTRSRLVAPKFIEERRGTYSYVWYDRRP